MKPNIQFMPLGGGQRVGASCYFLQIDKTNIILDAGIGKENGLEFEPQFSTLQQHFVESLNQISHIFISHAHMDHVGYLLKLMGQASRTNVYMTPTTKMLAEYQLYDRLYLEGKDGKKSEKARLATQSMFEKITTVNYLQTLEMGPCKVTFYPAGHIPGAMMVLFKIGKKTILYTGDYSIKNTLLTSECLFPKDYPVDTLIMCGLHAKHPYYKKSSDVLVQKANTVLNKAKRQSVVCYVPQLSKGIEFLTILNALNTGVPIYVDASIRTIINKIGNRSIQLLNHSNKVLSSAFPKGHSIFLTSSKDASILKNVRDIEKIDFTLHDDFDEIKQFIKTIKPRQAVMVHCEKERSLDDNTIEQDIMKDGECQTQFIFAQEQEIYQL